MLIEVLKPDYVFEDDRGILAQLVDHGFKQINVIKSKAGSLRGNHYHKINREVFYVVQGDFVLTAQKDGMIEAQHFHTGDMFLVPPYVIHRFQYESDSILVGMYDVGVFIDNTMDSYKIII